jgi:hypothetical protein
VCEQVLGSNEDSDWGEIGPSSAFVITVVLEDKRGKVSK